LLVKLLMMLVLMMCWFCVVADARVDVGNAVDFVLMECLMTLLLSLLLMELKVLLMIITGFT